MSKKIINLSLSKLLSINWLILSLIIVYPWLLIWQWLDITDTWFVLTNYNLIFSSPWDIIYSFPYYLTNIFWNIILHLFWDLWLLGIRIWWIINIYILLSITFLLFRNIINSKILLIGLLIWEIYANNIGWHMFNYNQLSAIFYLLSILLLYKWLTKNINKLIFLSWIIITINIFIRLPNILWILLISWIPFYYYLIWNKKQIINKSLLFILWNIIWVILLLTFMKLLWHYNYYIDWLWIIFDISKWWHHSTDSLINLFIKDNIYSIILSLILLIFLFIYKKFLWIINNNYKIYTIIVFWIIWWILLNMIDVSRWLMLWLTYLSFIYIIVYEKNNNIKLLVFLTTLFLILIPLWSWNWVYNIKHWIYPLILILIYIIRINQLNSFYKHIWKYWITTLLINILFYSLIYVYNNTYRDWKKVNLTYLVNNNKIWYIYTTKERSKILEETIIELNKYVKKDNYLLAYGWLSLFYYITDTKPYLYNSRPSLYNEYHMKYFLEKAIKEKNKLPVIIINKYDTDTKYWPQTLSTKKYNNNEQMKNRAIINWFIINNNYKKVWWNEIFDILIPKN